MTRALLTLALTTLAAAAYAVPVTFRYTPEAPARSVSVAGTFNNWDKAANPMTETAGTWTTSVDIQPGPVQYKFVVNNDTWVTDPNAGPPIPPDDNSVLWVVPPGESEAHALDDGKILAFAVRAEEPARVGKNTVRFTVTTAANDVQSVTLLAWLEPPTSSTGDTFGAGTRAAITTELTRAADGPTDTFSVICPASGLVRYHFLLKDGHSTWTLGANGVQAGSVTNSDLLLEVNAMPFLETPAWAPDTVWYQIFPERFANGNRRNDTKPPKGVRDWNTPLSAVSGNPNDHWWGGDLQGVINKLPYLKSLGVNGIYLNPVFEGPDTHFYATTDYFKVAPQLGDEATLKRLVKDAHKRGIRVMLDGVFNHTSVYFFAFQDILKNQEKSRYKDWYHIKSFPVLDPTKNYTDEDGKTLPYEGWWGIKWMPKLNVDNPETAAYLLKVATYWIEKTDIDGWRLDVANEVSESFWRKFRKAVKTAKPDAIIIGEVWDNSAQWLKGDQFDAVMNYPFRGAALDFFAHGKTDAQQFSGRLEAVRDWYSPAANAAMLNLLGSHDTARLLTEADGNIERAALAIFFQMTYPGSPSIYYGDENGVEGKNDPWNRAPMVWDKNRWNATLHETTQRAVALRNAHPALRGLDIETLYAPKGAKAVAFLRRGGGETMITAFNAGNTEATLAIPLTDGLPTRWAEAWRNGSATVKDRTLTITLPPLSGAALVGKSAE